MRAAPLAHGGRQTRRATTTRPKTQRYKQVLDVAALDEAERRSFRMTNEDAAMWRDYRVFKFAGLLHEWKRIYKARLPQYMHERLRID